MTSQEIVFNEIPLTFNNEFLTFNGDLPGSGLDPDEIAVGWGDDAWGNDWWGSWYGLAPSDMPSHISHTKERPPVAPRARF